MVVTIIGVRNLNFLAIFLKTLKSVNGATNTFVIFSNAAGQIVVCPKREKYTTQKQATRKVSTLIRLVNITHKLKDFEAWRMVNNGGWTKWEREREREREKGKWEKWILFDQA